MNKKGLKNFLVITSDPLQCVNHVGVKEGSSTSSQWKNLLSVTEQSSYKCGNSAIKLKRILQFYQLRLQMFQIKVFIAFVLLNLFCAIRIANCKNATYSYNF
jgi:hypothetical protein